MQLFVGLQCFDEVVFEVFFGYVFGVCFIKGDLFALEFFEYGATYEFHGGYAVIFGVVVYSFFEGGGHPDSYLQIVFRF